MPNDPLANIETRYLREYLAQLPTGPGSQVVGTDLTAVAGLMNTETVQQIVADITSAAIAPAIQTYMETGVYEPNIIGAEPQPVTQPLDHWSVVDLRKFKSNAGQGDEDVDTQAFLLAAASGERRIRLNRGTYRIAETIEIPVGVYFDAESGYRTGGVSLFSVAGGVYTENFLFFMNILKAAPSVAAVDFADIGAGGVKNVLINGTATGGINGFKFAGGYDFENIDTRQVNCLIRKPSIYTDKIRAVRLNAFNRGPGSDYFVDLPGLGDAHEIAVIASGFVGPVANTPLGASNSLGVRVGGSRGCSIYGLINGIHKFYNGAYEIHGSHIEGGRIDLEDCYANLHDNWLPGDANSGDGPPVRMLSLGGSQGARFEAVLRDNVFDAAMNGRGGWPSTQRGDVRIHPHWTVTLEGNRRRTNFDGFTDRQNSMGIFLEDSSGALLDDYNNYSHLFANLPTQIVNEKVRQTGSAPGIRETFGGFNPITTQSTAGVTFKAPAATYYYSAAIVTDPVRMIGRQASGGAEQSVSLVNGGAYPLLSINWNSVTIRSGYLMRVYRGTSPGVYDKFADIPIMSVILLYDDGLAINNFVWKSRTPSGIDAFNNGLNGEIVFEEGRLRTKTTIGSKPTLGTWKTGDVVTRENPVIPAVGATFVSAFRRLNDGSAHVDGTDWLSSAETRFS